jgi:hypothetical protein
MKYGNLTLGQIEAGINKIGGEEAFMRLLRGELTVSPPTADLHEIRLSVTSDGTTGKAWIKRLEKKGFRVSDGAKQLLLSSEFKPTKGVTHQVVVIKGSFWKKDIVRTTSNIRAEADKRKLEAPNAELACLVREKFTDKELEAMGLRWVIVMHEPIKDSDANPGLLSMGRGDGDSWLITRYDEPGRKWNRDDGFAFVVSQDSA